MKSKLWIALLIVTILIAGCGQTVETPSGGRDVGGQILQLALPRLVVDVDAEGFPSILGISPALLEVFGVDVSGFKLPPDLVATVTEAGLQHIEIASVGDRLVIYVDGKPVPHIGWSPESMARAFDLMAALDVQNADVLKRIIPPVTRFGLDLVMRFSRQPGAAEIPMSEAGSAKSLAYSPRSEAAAAIAKAEITYDEEGMPGMAGLSPADLETALAPLGLAMPRLSPEVLAKMQAGNIQHIELRTKTDGLYVYVNGEALPKLIWDNVLIGNLVEVIGKVSPDYPLLPLVQALAPDLDRLDVDIMLHFPVAAGQPPIPAEMHD